MLGADSLGPQPCHLVLHQGCKQRLLRLIRTVPAPIPTQLPSRGGYLNLPMRGDTTSTGPRPMSAGRTKQSDLPAPVLARTRVSRPGERSGRDR